MQFQIESRCWDVIYKRTTITDIFTLTIEENYKRQGQEVAPKTDSKPDFSKKKDSLTYGLSNLYRTFNHKNTIKRARF